MVAHTACMDYIVVMLDVGAFQKRLDIDQLTSSGIGATSLSIERHVCDYVTSLAIGRH